MNKINTYIAEDSTGYNRALFEVQCDAEADIRSIVITPRLISQESSYFRDELWLDHMNAFRVECYSKGLINDADIEYHVDRKLLPIASSNYPFFDGSNAPVIPIDITNPSTELIQIVEKKLSYYNAESATLFSIAGKEVKEIVHIYKNYSSK